MLWQIRALYILLGMGSVAFIRIFFSMRSEILATGDKGLIWEYVPVYAIGCIGGLKSNGTKTYAKEK